MFEQIENEQNLIIKKTEYCIRKKTYLVEK